MLKNTYIFIFVIACSCNWAKEKTKETVNKTGEVVAKTGSEFIDGVEKGVEKTFKHKVELSDALKAKKLSTGKILILSSDTTEDNILSVYFIFDDDINQEISLKIIDDLGQEYGRKKQLIKAAKNEAKYIDFVFDKRTKISSQSRLIFE